jgi:predicted CoA-binding protein
MELNEIMRQQCFVVVGDTLNEEKYAYKIKHGLLGRGYTVYSVGKELSSINDVPESIDIIDLCIHPAKGIGLLRGLNKPFKCIVIQPGAESEEIEAYLAENDMPYIHGCLLVGLSLYAEKERDSEPYSG